MFKKFTPEEGISNRAQAKTSVARGIRQQLIQQYPNIEEVLNDLWPKKAVIELIKCRNGASLIAVEGQVLFFQMRDGPFLPHLKFLHQYPDMLPSVTADRGAIKHVLGGSDVMDHGLTSPGGKLPDDEHCIEKGGCICLLGEGKELAMAVGILLKSTKEIREINDGKGVLNLHSIGDGLWSMWIEKDKEVEK